MSQMEASCPRKIHSKRTKENFVEREIAVKSLFLSENEQEKRIVSSKVSILKDNTWFSVKFGL